MTDNYKVAKFAGSFSGKCNKKYYNCAACMSGEGLTCRMPMKITDRQTNDWQIEYL